MVIWSLFETGISKLMLPCMTQQCRPVWFLEEISVFLGVCPVRGCNWAQFLRTSLGANAQSCVLIWYLVLAERSPSARCPEYSASGQLCSTRVAWLWVSFSVWWETLLSFCKVTLPGRMAGMAVVVFAVPVVWLRKMTGSNLKVFPVVHLGVGCYFREAVRQHATVISWVCLAGDRGVFTQVGLHCPLKGLLSAMHRVQVLGRWLFW